MRYAFSVLKVQVYTVVILEQALCSASPHYCFIKRLAPPLAVSPCSEEVHAQICQEKTRMKSVTLVVFAVLLVAVSCRPDKPDLKQLKAEAARKKACMRDCTTVKFDPVCGGKDGEKPKSFGSECVMNNYNCEHKDTLHTLKKGECPGSDGIRLS